MQSTGNILIGQVFPPCIDNHENNPVAWLFPVAAFEAIGFPDFSFDAVAVNGFFKLALWYGKSYLQGLFGFLRGQHQPTYAQGVLRQRFPFLKDLGNPFAALEPLVPGECEALHGTKVDFF